MHRIREDFNNFDDHKGPGGGALPYLAYTGMCRWTGYGFKVLSLKEGTQFHY